MKHTVKLWAFRAMAYPLVPVTTALILLYRLFDWASDRAIAAGDALGDIEDRLVARRDFFRGTTS